jgi:hypothetical protein
MSASAHAVLPYVTACQEDFVGDPATISIPVLVIHGDQDRVLPYEASGSRLPALLRDDQPPRARAPITIDLDTTDVEVYDRKKHGGTGSVHSTRAPLTLTMPANTMRDWIATGRAFMRARLAAAQLGLRFHPVSQVVRGVPADGPAAHRDEHADGHGRARQAADAGTGRADQPARPVTAARPERDRPAPIGPAYAAGVICRAWPSTGSAGPIRARQERSHRCGCGRRSRSSAPTNC